jgi:hypothetical protein
MTSRPVTQWYSYLRDHSSIVKEMIQDRDVYRGDRGILYSDRVTRANYLAMAAYDAMPYTGETVLVIAKDRKIDPARDPRLDWGKLSQAGHELRRISGNDSGQLFIPPYVTELAVVLTEILEQRSTECTK